MCFTKSYKSVCGYEKNFGGSDETVELHERTSRVPSDLANLAEDVCMISITVIMLFVTAV